MIVRGDYAKNLSKNHGVGVNVVDQFLYYGGGCP